MQDAVAKLRAWFRQTDEKGAVIYDSQAIQGQIARFTSLLDSITTDQNKEKLERFTSNISQISGADEQIKKLSVLKDELDIFKATFDAKASAVDSNIPQLDISKQADAIEAATIAAVSQVASGQAQNIQIRADFAQVYTGDLSGLLQNAEAYRASIERLRSNLEIIAAKQKELEISMIKRAELPDLISAELDRQKAAIDDRWQSVQQGQSDWTIEQRDLMKRILADRQISLEGRIIFDTIAFMTQLKDVLNLRSFRATSELTIDDRVRQTFPITSTDDFLMFMKTSLHTIEAEDFVSGDLAGLFYDVTKRSKFLRVEPVISYGGRPLDRLSVGQKGTVYLCLKLATQAFTQPLIFDQPEDDLDNEFIIEELVDIFRGIKQFRQVILVSHNANLVVNADADQVIVAQNDSGVLRYSSGSLEDPAINRAVRRILEGGDAAFLKRELRYNLK